MSAQRYLASLLVMAAALVLSASAVHAEPGPLNYQYSYSASAYNDSATLVEFTIEFSDAGLVYARQKDGTVTGQLYTRLRLRDVTGGSPIIVDWITAVPKPAQTEAQTMLGSQLVTLAPGKYAAQIYYQDEAEPQRRDSTNFDLVVPAFTGSKLQLSDIIVANEASQSDDPSNPFFRNGYTVLPNVAAVITPPFLVLNTYLEVYNADKVPTSEYHLSYKLADSNRTIFYESQVSRPRASGRIAVELNSLPLDSLPSGTYYLIVKAYNGFMRSASDSVMRYRSFILRNPEFDQVIAARSVMPGMDSSMISNQVIDPIYAGLKDTELDDEYSKVKYIASDMEKKVWEDMAGAEAKGRFLTHFWAARDPSPGTPVNEDRDEYFKRVEDAANLYSAPMAPHGWDSDRGRILLKYGKPDGVGRFFQEFNKKPYEIWTYTQRGYQFVFIDRTQTGAFSLVHSNAPSEVKNENWEQVATISNAQSGSAGSQSR